MNLVRLFSSSSVSPRCISGPNIYLLVSLIIFHALCHSERSQARQRNGFQPLSSSSTAFSFDVKHLLLLNSSNAVHFIEEFQGKNLCNLVKNSVILSISSRSRF